MQCLCGQELAWRRYSRADLLWHRGPVQVARCDAVQGLAAPAAGTTATKPVAFADRIAADSAKSSEAACPIVRKIDWGNTTEIARYIAEEFAKDPKGAAAAVDKALVDGLAVDPALAAAFADQIADASAKSSEVASPIAQKEDWGNTTDIARNIAEESAEDTKGAAAAVDKVFEAGLAEGPALAADFADQIADASARSSEVACPIGQKIDWGNATDIVRHIAEQSAMDPKGDAAAVDKALEAGRTPGPAMAAAFAGHIADASAQSSQAACPIVQQTDWGNATEIARHIVEESAKGAERAPVADDKELESGLTTDPMSLRLDERDGMWHNFRWWDLASISRVNRECRAMIEAFIIEKNRRVVQDLTWRFRHVRA